MYLLRQRWSRREALVFLSAVSTLPWIFLLGLAHILSGSDLSLELGIAASGFLALAFSGFLALLLFLFSLALSLPDLTFFLRRILGLYLLLSPLAIILTSLFPLNIVLTSLASFFLLSRLAPDWQQRLPEETVRLEPIFFLTVGFKVVLVALLVSYLVF